jgi:hypothetical protein
MIESRNEPSQDLTVLPTRHAVLQNLAAEADPSDASEIDLRSETNISQGRLPQGVDAQSWGERRFGLDISSGPGQKELTVESSSAACGHNNLDQRLGARARRAPMGARPA